MNIYVEKGIVDTLFSLASDNPNNFGKATDLLEDKIDPYTVEDLYDLILVALVKNSGSKKIAEMLRLFFPDKDLPQVSKESFVNMIERSYLVEVFSDDTDGGSPQRDRGRKIVKDPNNLSSKFISTYAEKAEDIIVEFIGKEVMGIIQDVDTFYAKNNAEAIKKDKKNYQERTPEAQQYIGYIFQQLTTRNNGKLITDLENLWSEFTKQSRRVSSQSGDDVGNFSGLRSGGNSKSSGNRNSFSRVEPKDIDPRDKEVIRALSALDFSDNEIKQLVASTDKGDTVEVRIANALRAYDSGKERKR